MTTKTLLEQAKEVSVANQGQRNELATREQFDLVMAYLHGEVTNRQVGTVIGQRTSVFTFAGKCLIAGVRNGWLIENTKK